MGVARGNRYDTANFASKGWEEPEEELNGSAHRPFHGNNKLLTYSMINGELKFKLGIQNIIVTAVVSHHS